MTTIVRTRDKERFQNANFCTLFSLPYDTTIHSNRFMETLRMYVNITGYGEEIRIPKLIKILFELLWLIGGDGQPKMIA